ncbi:hypothetical protein [Streptomyces meridianus]|uniref:Integral membrane protein n=1 Tax=Streptomyces meridianus TaxID=2938945 RepID=A0ABT0X818_9ACTN|nr:hypothetical protein [Streptomyces meridianus]MCM2578564.1 hypothetical protein [Streptomyces meridianus]
MHVPVARVSAGPRLLRAAMFTAVCVVLSAAGHAVGSGRPLPMWTLAAGFAVVLAAAGPLAGRGRSVPGVAAGLALGQAALHLLFGLAQHYCAAPPRTGASGRTVALAARITCNDGPVPPSAAEARRIVHAAGIDPSAHGGPGGHGSAAHDALSSSLLPSLPMLLGHLLAAVVLGLLLSRGDAALVRLIGLSAGSVAEQALARSLRAAVTLLHSVRAGLPGTPATLPRAPLVRSRNRTGPGSTELDHSVARRGPPRFALAA